MSQTFVVIDQATQTGTQIFAALQTQTSSLLTCFSGPTAPTTPTAVKGKLWFDDVNNILNVYDGTGWVTVTSEIQANVDFNLNQITNGRLENTASNPTPASGNVGYAVLHTGAAKAKIVVSATVLETLVSHSNADLWSIPLPITRWFKDATNPPTDVVIGTTPQWHTYLFDATNERMHTTVTLPRGFSEDADLILRVHYLLNAAESASDVLAALVDYKKLDLDSTDAADGTSTQATASAQSIGANAGQYTYHKCDILLTFNDANNPVTKNDALALSWGLSAVSSVAQAAVFHAELLSPIGALGISEVA